MMELAEQLTGLDFMVKVSGSMVRVKKEAKTASRNFGLKNKSIFVLVPKMSNIIREIDLGKKIQFEMSRRHSCHSSKYVVYRSQDLRKKSGIRIED